MASVWWWRHAFSSRSGSCTLPGKGQDMATGAEHSSVRLSSQQSDLNIIEEVWNMKIAKRRMRSCRLTNLVELKGLIANTWSSIQVQGLESLAASMPKRIAKELHPSKRWSFKGSQNIKCQFLTVFLLFFYCFLLFLIIKGFKCWKLT